MSAPPVTKWVYDFDEGSRDMRGLLGGKGANLAEMAHVLGADLVPSGFTVTTEACVRYLGEGGSFPDGLAEDVEAALARLEASAGKRFGDAGDPLLVSVRSGARDSMPGMMDTVLDLGLNHASVLGLAAQTGNERFAWDSYRRLVQMFGNVVHGIPGAHFEGHIARIKEACGVHVGELVALALQRGRRQRPELQAGVCGEHGGDPDSIRFFRRAGLDYTSCSPYRLPIARVAAAQAEERR